MFNTAGYTKGARTEIFALRPAPIQVGWLGFAGSLGADFYQYAVADNVVAPAPLRSQVSGAARRVLLGGENTHLCISQ